MTREKCASLCGKFAAQNPTKQIYAAAEAAEQCRCGMVDPDVAGGDKLDPSECNMACAGDQYHMCGGGWKADVFKVTCVKSDSEPATEDFAVVESNGPSNHPADVGAAVVAGSAADVRGTHAALDGGGPNSHYLLAWMTTTEVTLQSTDLYPAPKVHSASSQC
jgi:hypothetical protein